MLWGVSSVKYTKPANFNMKFSLIHRPVELGFHAFVIQSKAAKE